MKNPTWTPLQKQIYYQLKAGGAVSSIAASLLCSKSLVYFIKAAVEQGFMPPEEVERLSPVHNLLKKKAQKPLRSESNRKEMKEEVQRNLDDLDKKEKEAREIIADHDKKHEEKPSQPLNEKNWHSANPFGGLLLRREVIPRANEILEQADRDLYLLEAARLRYETARLDLEYAELKKRLAEPKDKPAEKAAPAAPVMTLAEVIKLLIINWKEEA